MNTHEGRLHAMLGPESKAGWNLNDEDRAAIRWAMETIAEMKDQLWTSRDEHTRTLRSRTSRRDRLRSALKAIERDLDQL